MRVAGIVTIAVLLLPIAAQAEQSYRVYTEHPRLWLNARHLRLLRLVLQTQPRPFGCGIVALRYFAANRKFGSFAEFP